MNERQFLGGLSGGASFLAIGGVFWPSLGISEIAASVGCLVCTLLMVLQVGGGATLVWAAVRLRRRSRLRASDPKQIDGRQKAETRHIMIVFLATVVAQTVLIGSAVYWCVRAHAEPLIWPSIALVVSLHLVPFARIFHVRAYYVTAGAGSIDALAGFTSLTALYPLACLGGGMTAVMWASAAYLLSQADRIAGRALREPWAV
jgi:hypothetical protein